MVQYLLNVQKVMALTAKCINIQPSHHIVNPVNVSGQRPTHYGVVVLFYVKYPSLF